MYVMGVHAKNSLNRLVNRCHIHSLFEITNKEMIAASTFIFSMKCMIELKRVLDGKLCGCIYSEKIKFFLSAPLILCCFEAPILSDSPVMQ